MQGRLEVVENTIIKIEDVEITKPFEVRDLTLNGSISVFVNGLAEPLEFDVHIYPQYPLSLIHIQMCIRDSLNGMRDLGLIKSRNVKIDNRVKMISLTPYGVQLLGQLREKIWRDVDIIVREILGLSAPNFTCLLYNSRCV